MLIQKQYNKLILQEFYPETEIQIQQCFLLLKKQKKTVLDFSQGTVKVLWIYFTLIQYQHKITQNNALNVKLSNSQLNILKSGIKNGTEVTIKLSSNAVGDSNDETNFPHKMLFINWYTSFEAS